MDNIEVISVEAQAHSAVLVKDDLLVERLDRHFSDALQLSDRLSNLTHSLDLKGTRYCVFGGWIRDTICNVKDLPISAPPRDIDLVVRGIEIEDLLKILPFDVRSTIFGGVQSDERPIPFDIWPLHETFLIKYFNMAPTFDNLLLSTDFNINSALFFPSQGASGPKIIDGGMLEALRTRTLAFNGASLPFPVMQCARIAAYAGKLSLRLSPPVQTFMKTFISQPDVLNKILTGICQFYSENTARLGKDVIQSLLEDGS